MPIDPDTLARVYGRHPARTMPFDELSAGLDAEVARQNVFRVRDGALELFVYTTACVFERRWGLFSLMSRGLVIDRAAGAVVATPFPKFFNLGEVIDSVPDLPFDVTEKVDGSLGIVFRHDNTWRVATKGAFRSDQALWATRHLNEHCRPAALSPDTTYLCEIVYPENRIVVPYDYAGLVLLGAYDAEGDELSRDALAAVAGAAGFRLAGSEHHGSLDELIDVARRLPCQVEGFVVRFANGLRLKFKGEEYCRIHRLISRCTPLTIWESMLAGDDLDATRRDMPEEVLADFDAIRRLLEARLAALVDDVLDAAERTRHLSNKDLGLLVQSEGHGGLSEAARDFVFAGRKADLRAQLARPGRVRDAVFRHLRPAGNRLPGYEPSTAMNRFREESA